MKYLDKDKINQKVENFKGTQRYDGFGKLSFTIILVQLETASHAGSVARLIKNFDFKELVIFNPIASNKQILNYETQGFAMHGKDILLNSTIINVEDQQHHIHTLKEYLKQFDLTIGTTAKGKHYTNLSRLSIFPDDFDLPRSQKSLNIAVLFGKESRGLTNEELDLIDILLRIPASESYPTLNLSHAVGIILYELYRKLHSIPLGRGENPVLLSDKEDRQILYQHIQELIRKIKIRNFREKDTLQALKNIIERAMMTNRELTLILGLFSKLNSLLKDVELFDDEK